MQFLYIDEREAKELWEARVPVFNRFRNSDRQSMHYQEWSEWYDVAGWEESDWTYIRHHWEDEFRVEVE
jgi:hypothetical protein